MNVQQPKALAQVLSKVPADHYAWLRDANWPSVSCEEILFFLEAENKKTSEYLSRWSEVRKEIFDELKGRIAQFDETPPVRRGNFFYWTRFEEGKEQPVFCRKNVADGSVELLLDVNRLAECKEFAKVATAAPSSDNRYFAYCIDYQGREEYEIRVLQGELLLNDLVHKTSGNLVWHQTLPGFFYAKLNDNARADRIFFHALGSCTEDDQLIFFESDARFSLSLSQSSNRECIFIASNGHACNEIRYLQNESLFPELIREREEGIFYDVEHYGSEFYLRINDRGGNFRIAKLNQAEGLIDFIPQSEEYLESFDVSQSYMILNYKRKGVPSVKILDIAACSIKEISFPDESYVACAYCSNFQDDDVRISYSSLSTPDAVFKYRPEKLELLKQREIPSGFDSKEYLVRRLEAERNGVRIPITVFTKRDFKTGTCAPLYLTGYGSYGYAAYVGFSSFAVSLVNRGFAFAIAHVRGGDELGYDWYEAGKLLSKKNTFEDFITCTEHLIELGYASSGNIAVSGGSAGGMLIGAVINQRPELYKCAVALVPFVDVLNTMLDPQLPLTKCEYKEWGDPSEVEYFEYISSYCPYTNVKKQPYPTVLATSGLSDLRVGYWEAAKWIAKLREFNTGRSEMFLRTDMSVGHQGAPGRFKRLEEAADELTFILSTMLY